MIKGFLSRGTRALALAGLLLVPTAALAQETTPPGGFAPGDRERIEEVIRDYLLRHPEVVLEALRTLEERERLAAEARRKEMLVALKPRLEAADTSPVLGNPDGDVVVVEFFDYQCGYCRNVAERLREAVAADGNIKLVMKEFPILGDTSLFAARAALAAARQDKYEAFHWSMMRHKGPLNEDIIFALAGHAGLDVAQLQQDMQHPEVDAELQHNYDLAEQLDIRGTPAFIVGETLVPGALPMSQLQELIEQSRAGKG